jgi:ribosome-associated protein
MKESDRDKKNRVYQERQYQSVSDDDNEEQEKSKSQIKREMHELQALGQQLVELPAKQLIDIPISEKLRDAVISAKSLKHGAIRRQLQYIGSLMPKEDEASIRTMLHKLQQPHKDDVKAFHQLEQWRDQLLQGDQALQEELANKFENFDRQYIRQLIRNAKKEQELNKSPKSARLLFKYLTELQISPEKV